MIEDVDQVVLCQGVPRPPLVRLLFLLSLLDFIFNTEVIEVLNWLSSNLLQMINLVDKVELHMYTLVAPSYMNE